MRVVGRRQLAPSVIELELAADDGGPLPAWDPGAHIDLRLGDEMIRQYSLVEIERSAPTWTVAVLIENEGRGGSRAIAKTLHPASTVKSSGPRNHFPQVSAASYLFIAGGIGVTPLIAMARAAESAGAEWRMAYLGRDRDSMAYLSLLEDEFPGKVDVYTGAEGSRLDVTATLEALSADTHVYCCGPDRLMKEVEEAMSSPTRLPFVHLEHFHPRSAETDWENTEFTVYAVKSDIEFSVPSDESILMAADFEGVVVPGDCLEGTCGSCETRVLRGEIQHRDSILGPQARAESKTMMICVSRAMPGCDRLELDL